MKMPFATIAALQAFFLAMEVCGKPAMMARPVPDGARLDGNMVRWRGQGNFDEMFACPADGGYITLSADKRAAGCCEDEDQALFGSLEDGYHCCAAGHHLAGSKKVGFECCPADHTFDGEQCTQVCDNGKELIDGHCVCPEGTAETPEGDCKALDCTSGLETGKCYMFQGMSGQRLSFSANQYSEAAPSKAVIPGKFQLCKDEACTPGNPINPSHAVYIRDLHGALATGAGAGRWLDKKSEGAHIGRTPNFPDAGQFAFTKWPCGKYCLSGFTQGLGLACPVTNPAITFYSKNPQACVEFELIEVPCDIRSDENNCAWKSSGNQCCGRVDCKDEL